MKELPGGPEVKTWAFTAVDPGSIPGRGTKIPQAAWCGKERKEGRKEGRKKRMMMIWTR